MKRQRYLLIVGDAVRRAALAATVARAAQQAGLTERIEGAGFSLLHGSDLGVQALGRNSYVLGTILSRDRSGTLEQLGQPACASGGSLLIERFWGDYVALIVHSDPDQIRALRSPSGGLHAYRADRGGLAFLASDADVLVASGTADCEINWDFVAHHLRYPHLVGALTGLVGVSEIFPGDIQDISSAEGKRRALWSPWTYSDRERQLDDIARAQENLRATIFDAVGALKGSARSILLELSGGLDSSILAAALLHSGACARAVNLVTATREGDERDYARATAARTGLSLEEELLPSHVDLTRLPATRLARPGIPAILRDADDRLLARGRVHNCDAYFTGSGGDAVFCSLASAAAAADIYLEYGLGWRFGRTVRALSTVHAASLWQVARLAIRQARRGALHRGWAPADAFLLPEAMPAAPQYHPWLDEPANARPGERAHIRSIMSTLAHLDGYAREEQAGLILPLLSQPVIETCLSIPSWLWVEGGRDRAVARLAFRSYLPAKVLNRRTKGRIDAYCVGNLARGLGAVRPFLLDGVLAASGLFDTGALEQSLLPGNALDPASVYRILPLIDVEAWLRSWA